MAGFLTMPLKMPSLLSRLVTDIHDGLVWNKSPSASVGGVFLWPERGAGRVGINLVANHARWNTDASDRKFGPSSLLPFLLPKVRTSVSHSIAFSYIRLHSLVAA